MSWWRRRGLRFKIGLGVNLGLILVLGSILYGIVRYIQAQLRQREFQAAAQMTALVRTSLENLHVSNQGWEGIEVSLRELGRETEAQMEDIAVFSLRGEPGPAGISLHSELILFVSDLPEGRVIRQESLERQQEDVGCWECHQSPVANRPDVVLVSLEGEQVLRGVQPLSTQPRCRVCHQTTKEHLGLALVDFRLKKYQDTANLITLVLLGGGGLAALLVSGALYLLLYRMILAPLQGLVRVTQAVGRGQWNQRVQVRSSDEVGQLGAAFNEMTEQLAATYTELGQSLDEREEKAAALQRALDEVHQGQEEQARLLETIRQMSTPVVPVHEGVLVMPLVGIIDQPRAQRIVEALLVAVEKERAHVVILDITGVPMVDTAVAQSLLLASQAVCLLGAESVLVGITPQVAETIVSLGVDLSDLTTQADLQGGVAYALRQLKAGRMRG